MSDAHEQSYYEIALTNRQVLVAFVILLSCVLIAFFAGVWVGRGAPQVAAEPTAEQEQVADDGFEDPKEFEFFADQDVPEARPDMREIAENPNPDTTLAQDLGVEPKAKARETAPAAAAPAEESAPAKRPRREEKAAAPPPAPAPAPTTNGEPASSEAEVLVIQVFSSRDEVQARRLVTTLQEAGFQAFLSPVETDGTTMFRVRIGPFGDRDQAESVADRVRSRFKVDTWITGS